MPHLHSLHANAGNVCALPRVVRAVGVQVCNELWMVDCSGQSGVGSGPCGDKAPCSMP